MKSLIITLIIFTIAALNPSYAAVLNIKQVTSKQGITAWLVEDHNVPVISIEFKFKGAGAANDPSELQGLSQMLANTMDEGAGNLNAQQFQSELQNKSISLTFNQSRDTFGGNVKTLSKYKQDAFKLLHLALTAPHFDAEAVERMRNTNLSNMRSNLSDPEWLSARLVNSVLYNGHNYAHNSGGTLSSLKRITADDLRHKQQTELAKDNLLISVAGDITADELVMILDEIFGKLPDKAKLNTIKDVNFPEKSDMILFQKDIPQTFITIAMKGIAVNDNDYPAAEVLNFVFGSSGFGSRLTDLIREKNGLTYGIYSDFINMEHANLLTIGTSTKNDTVMDVVNFSKMVMDDLAKNSITEKELRDAKTYIIGSTTLQLTSTSNIVNTMIWMQVMGLKPDFLDERIKAIEQVTINDVTKIAKRLLNINQIQIIMLGNPKIRDPQFKYVNTIPDIE